jgi:hypothetical protein
MMFYRILNAIVWLWLRLSDVLQPVDGSLLEKLFRLNSHIDEPARLLGNDLLPFVFWLAIDSALRRRRRKVA